MENDPTFNEVIHSMFKKLSSAILASLFLFTSPYISPAAVADGTLIPASVTQPMAAWVSQAMNVKIDKLPLVTASGRELKGSLGLQGVQQARSMAAYVPWRIVINNIIWDPESVRSRSYLVHEMVHHAQLVSKKIYPCNKAKEREAYLLQNQWLQEHGEDPMFSQEWIDRLSSCGSA
jgi:hypothetical protein